MAEHGDRRLVHPAILPRSLMLDPHVLRRKDLAPSNGLIGLPRRPCTPTVADLARGTPRNARDLPWRAPGTTPWGVLVSEVMLQQTPVVRVLPVWRAGWSAGRRRPPWPRTRPAEAIRAWGRLGYPRRALRLHACAVAIVRAHGGKVPDDVDELLALPGVGVHRPGRRRVRVPAAAPVVDTNVRRLVARVVAGDRRRRSGDHPGGPGAAEALLPAGPGRRPGACVAFMELGRAGLHGAGAPLRECPLRGRCAWRRRAAAGAEPPRRTPAVRRHRPPGTRSPARRVRGRGARAPARSTRSGRTAQRGRRWPGSLPTGWWSSSAKTSVPSPATTATEEAPARRPLAGAQWGSTAQTPTRARWLSPPGPVG